MPEETGPTGVEGEAIESAGAEEAPESFETELESLGVPMEGGEEVSPEAETEASAKEEAAPEAAEDRGDLGKALQQARRMHREDLSRIQGENQQRFEMLLHRFEELMAEPYEEEATPTLDEDPEAALRAIVKEELEPLREQSEVDEQRAEEAVVEELSGEVGNFVSADWDIGRERFGDEALTTAVGFVVGEEMRGLRSRHPEASEQWLSNKFYADVLPGLHLHYATNGWSLTDMAISRAQNAGVLPKDLSAPPAAPPNGGETKPAKPRGRVATAARARPSLSSVPGTTPKGKPGLEEVLAMPPGQYNKWVGGASFDELLGMLATPIT